MRHLARSLALAALAALLVACGNAVTQANYDRIEHGMTLEQVEDILGSPTTRDLQSVGIGDVRFEAGVCAWEGGGATISVTLAQGKVVTKMSEGL